MNEQLELYSINQLINESILIEGSLNAEGKRLLSYYCTISIIHPSIHTSIYPRVHDDDDAAAAIPFARSAAELP